MMTRRSKRLSKIPLDKSESSDLEETGKKQKLDLNNSLCVGKLTGNITSKSEVNGNRFDNQNGSPNKNGNDSDSSDSSVDYMKSPNTLDLNSDFFKVDFRKREHASEFSFEESPSTSKGRQVIESEDSSSGDDKKNSQESLPAPLILTQFALAQSKKTNTSNTIKFDKKLNKKRIKQKSCNSNATKKSDQRKVNKGTPCMKTENVDDMNVLELLALGETQVIKDLPKTELVSASEDELTDWEEVKGEEGKEIKTENHSFPKEGVQITVNDSDLYHKRKKKDFDLSAFLKRRINQVKREQQILIHKVHLLCWIAHGLFVNSVLNSENLMGLALSLIPSQHCYPNKVDTVYLKKISCWFVKSVPVVERISEKASFVPLHKSLQQQFERSTAQSHRDQVFLFVCLLLSLGLSVRLIISLQPLPLKLTVNDLAHVKSKKGQSHNKKSDQKTEKKVLSPDEARNLRKNVISKQEALKRLKSSETGVINRVSKSKKPKTEKNVCEEEKSNNGQSKRCFRPRKCMENKYKDINSSSDEEMAEKNPNAKSTDNESSNKVKNKGRETLKGKNISKTVPMKDKIFKKNNAIINSSPERHECLAVNSKNTSENTLFPKKDITKVAPLKGVSPEAMKQHGKIGIIERISYSKLSPPNLACNKSKNTESLRAQKKETKLTSPVKNDLNEACSSQTSEDEFVKLTQNHSKPIKEGKPKNLRNSKKRTTSNKVGSDSDFEEELTNKIKLSKARNSIKTEKDRRVLSTDSDDSGDSDKKFKSDFWVEVLVDSEQWVTVDVTTADVDCTGKLYKRATKPVTYIVAWNSDHTLKDVTRRYCTQFHSSTRKQRVDEEWWRETLFPFLTPNTALDRKEDEEMHKQMQDLPLPSSIAEYKNHPLYAMKRHLLKFQAIYPPDAPTLGFVKGEPVYARECVHTLHSREIWLKEAKVVRLGEQPYKIVKARPKWDRMSGKVVTDMPLEIFGSWQVEEYIPPTAKDGKVPRNAYGNVELFKPSMLPKGTIHLQVPGLNRVAKKLQIDCAPAVVGFDFHCGSSHPMYDGFVVCEEFEDILLDAWNRDQEEAERREHEKKEKRVYGNWRRLIKGLLIRERLKIKYAFGQAEASTSKSKKEKKTKHTPKTLIGKEEDTD